MPVTLVRSFRRSTRHLAVAAATVAVGVTASAPTGAGAADLAGPPPAVRGPGATHDPSMVRGGDGAYYVFSTHNGIEIRRSRDLVHWRFVGEVLPNGAAWASGYQPDGARDAWAPDVSRHRGRYYLYYAISSFGTNRSAIGLATSPSAKPGTWTDRGLVYASRTTDDFNAIDPSLTVDPQGRWWLSLGSFWSGIKMIRLDPATGRPASPDTPRYSLARRPAPDALEGAAISRHGGWYYLFASFDSCCRGVDSTYNIRVGRSRSITGPYVDRDGTSLTAGGGTILLSSHGDEIGPGGQSLLRDRGRDLLVHHYYDRRDAGTPRLRIDALGWRHGWPEVLPRRDG